MKPETIATLRSWISIVERSDTEALGRVYGVRFAFRGGAYEMRVAGIAGTATNGREAAKASWLRAARRRIALAEDECPGHVASDADRKVCGRCGAHVDGFRPPEDDRCNGLGSGSVLATGPYVDRLVRIFRDKPADDGCAVVLQDFGNAILAAALIGARESTPSPIVDDAMVTGWIVGNSGGNKWWHWNEHGYPGWTTDKSKAIRYARRQDAEAAHRDHDAAWVIVPVRGEENPVPALNDAIVERATHRHKKRGTEYALIGIGKMQSGTWIDTTRDDYADAVDMREVAIYRSVEDGSLWVRPREEFEDGRFETLNTALSGARERAPSSIVDDAMVKRAEVAYWHEVHHGTGYGEEAWRAALVAALGTDGGAL